MEWRDDGIIIDSRRHGENAAIVSLLTREHGRHAGLVRGGTRTRGMLQLGNRVQATWRARLAQHLGTLSCELLDPAAARVIAQPRRLAGLASMCAVLETALPEREPHPRVFAASLALLAAIADSDAWLSAYIKWELGLLAELGFGLDLSRCAATGTTADLVYVSPRSGRAVSRAAGEPYKDRMLALPSFLREAGATGVGDEIAQGLRLTGFFLERYLYAPRHTGLPAARERLRRRQQGRAPEEQS